MKPKCDIASEHFAAFAEYMGYVRAPDAENGESFSAVRRERDGLREELEETKAFLEEASKDRDFFDNERQKVVAELESALLEIDRMKPFSTEREQLQTALIEQLKKERDEAKDEAKRWMNSCLKMSGDLHAVSVVVGAAHDCRIPGTGQDAAIVKGILVERDELRAEVKTLRTCYTDSSRAVQRLSVELENIKSFFKQFEEK